MKKFLIGLSSVFMAIIPFGNYESKAKDIELTPYQTVVLATAVNYCSVEYGLMTEKQAYKSIISWVQDEHDFEPYQIYNLMQKKDFGVDTDDFIAKVGGCKTIASEVKKSLDRKPTGFSSLTSGKKDYEYFYKIDF